MNSKVSRCARCALLLFLVCALSGCGSLRYPIIMVIGDPTISAKRSRGEASRAVKTIQFRVSLRNYTSEPVEVAVVRAWAEIEGSKPVSLRVGRTIEPNIRIEMTVRCEAEIAMPGDAGFSEGSSPDEIVLQVRASNPEGEEIGTRTRKVRLD